MEIDSFLTSPRWKILEIISDEPSSPIEISAKINTSVAYVSQQLKLLEAADIVKKEKTGSAEKGKPRVVFSIAKDMVYLTILSNKFSTKKVVKIDEKNKIILRIWLLEDPYLRNCLERAYWTIEKNLDEISGIYLQINNGKKESLIFVSDSEKVKSKVNSIVKEIGERISVLCVKNFDVSNLNAGSTVLYQSNSFNNELKMKGGINK